jgi:hypothetical protein
VPILDYALHYNYIKTVLCVNKDKPEMHCNGQCHLKQMIKKETQEENGQNSKFPKIEINRIQFNCNKQVASVKVESILKNKKPIYKSSLVQQLVISKVFRPPIFV